MLCAGVSLSLSLSLSLLLCSPALGSGGGSERERESSMSSSPPRSGNRNQREKEKPRSFNAKARAFCWEKAEVVPGRHPDRWRRDAVGNIVCYRLWNCLGCLCYEFDHIVPFSKGGESTAENCQILQTRVNRFKSDKEGVARDELEGFSCDVKFTDKELDVIEMAVYGDVIRPGNQCRCRTVAEMLGLYKSKNPLAACELPYKEPSEQR
ncbi:hypothetical protein Taro_033113 [Colocasia esculenta]|uniref:HNH nuclease domain-containing protein n=1 Tax=Colocasia esculenta TaxID=4460 RepID=A0A843VZ86_COLES|nr:hypothetical protein [Colocasia esculenta]